MPHSTGRLEAELEDLVLEKKIKKKHTHTQKPCHYILPAIFFIQDKLLYRVECDTVDRGRGGLGVV